MHRILTYNVHRCLGTDKRLDPARIAEVIAACAPEIAALQELDVGRSRTGGLDQAERVAALLGMNFHFHATLRMETELYGVAIMTRRPLTLVKADVLPTIAANKPLEPRGALWVRTNVAGVTLDIVTAHLGLRGLERLAQARALLGPDWCGSPRATFPLILAGDFNAVPHSRAYRALASSLSDARISRRTPPTFPSRFPVLPLDHFFVSAPIHVVKVDTLRTKLARAASDHLPLFMDFTLGTSPSRHVEGADGQHHHHA